MIEVFGVHYLVTRFMGNTYSVRSMPNDEVIGLFMLDESETRIIGVDGMDVPLTLDVARAVLNAHPPLIETPAGVADSTAWSSDAPGESSMDPVRPD